MTVQAPQLHPLAVQVQPARHELHRAEAEPHRLFVQHTVRQAAGARADELHGEGVEGGVLDAPRVHAVQRAGDGQGQLAAVGGPAAGRAANFRLQGAAHRLAHSGGVDAEIALGFGLDEHVPQVGGLLDVQADGAVDAAEGQVVDLPAEGRDVQVFAAVAAHGYHILLAEAQGAGQVHGEGGVAAAMVEQPAPVAEDGGVVGDSPEGEQHGATLPLPGRKEFAPVAAQPLVFIFVAVVVGQHLHGVGDAHRLQLQHTLWAHERRVELGREQPAFVPIVVFHGSSPIEKITLHLIVTQRYERKKKPGAVLQRFLAAFSTKKRRVQIKTAFGMKCGCFLLRPLA